MLIAYYCIEFIGCSERLRGCEFCSSCAQGCISRTTTTRPSAG